MLSCYHMGLIQTDIALNKPLWIRGPKVATRQPLQGEWFCRWWPRIIALCLSFLTDFLLVLLFTWVLVIVGSTGQYFQPIRVPPIVQLTHKWHHKKVCCVSHDFQVRRRDARRWGVTWEDVERATEDHEPGSTIWGALPEPYKMTGLFMCMLWPNWNNQMKVGGPPVEPVLPAPRSLARLKLTREHQNWQVAHWYPVHFIDYVAGSTSFIRLLSLNLLLPVKRTGRQVWQVATPPHIT